MSEHRESEDFKIHRSEPKECQLVVTSPLQVTSECFFAMDATEEVLNHVQRANEIEGKSLSEGVCAHLCSGITDQKMDGRKMHRTREIIRHRVE